MRMRNLSGLAGLILALVWVSSAEAASYTRRYDSGSTHCSGTVSGYTVATTYSETTGKWTIKHVMTGISFSPPANSTGWKAVVFYGPVGGNSNDGPGGPALVTAAPGATLNVGMGVAIYAGTTAYTSGTDTEVFTVPPAPPQGPMAKHVTVKLKNDKDYPVTYRLIQDGVQIGEVTLQPHTALIQTFSAPKDSQIIVLADSKGITIDSDLNAWVVQPNAVTTQQVATVNVDANDSIPDNPPEITQPDTPQSNTSLPPASSSVWRSTGIPQDPNNDPLTKTLFREGVDRITSSIASLKTTSSGGGSSVNVDMSGVESRLDAIKNDTASLKSNVEAMKPTDAQKAALQGIPGEYDAAKASELLNGVKGNAGTMQSNAASAINDAMGTADGTALDTPQEPGPGTIQLKISPSKTLTVNLNPFSSDGPFGGVLGVVANLIKKLIAWALVGAFFYEISKEVRGVCGTAFLTGGYSSQTADFVKSVNIFGNAIGVPAGIALRVALIGLVVALVLTLPAVALAALEAGLPWGDLKAIYTAGMPGVSSVGGHSMLANALGYADRLLPWRLMLSMPLYYILVQNVLFPVQLFWQFVFKFLP